VVGNKYLYKWVIEWAKFSLLPTAQAADIRERFEAGQADMKAMADRYAKQVAKGGAK